MRTAFMVVGIVFAFASSLSFLLAFTKPTRPKDPPPPNEWDVSLHGLEAHSLAVVNTGIFYDGPNRFAVSKAGVKIWSGTPEEFIALVERGVNCK